MNTALIASLRAALVALLAGFDAQQAQIADLLKQLTAAEGQVIVLPGANLQSVMDAAPEGATVLLPAGVPFVGHYTCRKPLILTTGGVTLGEDERVSPLYAGKLAVLQSPDAQPAYAVAGGATGCRLIAVEIATNLNAYGTAVSVGTSTETAIDQYPQDVLLKQILIRGDVTTGLKRCIGLHGIGVTLEGSYIAGCRARGEDSQAVWVNCSPGPTRVVNNYLEAASENFLAGGATCNRPMGVAEDITIEDNTFSKPLAWKGIKGWNVKNLLEMKNARDVIIRGNLLENNWADAQAGHAILLTPRNQNGQGLNPWAVVESVVVEGNIIRNVSSAFNILGDDDEKGSARANHLTIRGNTLLVSKVAMGGDGYCGQIGRAPQQLVIEGNTCLNDGSHSWYTYTGGSVTTSADFVFRNNLQLHRTYGFDGVGLTGLPFQSLTRFYPGAVWEGNVIGGGATRDYPPGTTVLPLADFQAAFSDYQAGIVKADGPLAGKGATP